MKLRTLQLAGVRWRCCLCAAAGLEFNETAAWLAVGRHITRVHPWEPT